MVAKHRTRRRYNDGCRCDDCTAANTAYQEDYRQRRANGGPVRPAPVVSLSPPVTPPSCPGPVESGVESEIVELPQAQERPGLAAVALALGRLMDHPTALTAKAQAARQLADILATLSKRTRGSGGCRLCGR
jgi:hypothetical protein